MVSREMEALSSQNGETQILPGFQLLGPICLPLVVIARWWGGGGEYRKCQTEACVLLGKAKAAVGNHTLSGARIPSPGQGPIAKSDFPSPHLLPMRKTNETFSFLTWAAPSACLVTLPSSIPHSQPLPLSVIHKPSAAPTLLCLQVAGAGAAGEKPAP